MKSRTSKPDRRFWVLQNPEKLKKDAAQFCVACPGRFTSGAGLPAGTFARVNVLQSGDFWAFWETANGWLAAHDFADRVCAELGDLVQRIPIKSEVTSLEEDYEILNFVGAADCFDHGRSDYTAGSLEPDISWARRIALCEHLLPSANVFRVTFTPYLFVDDEGKASLMRAGIPDIYFDGSLAFSVCGERSPIPQPPEPTADPYEGEKVRLTKEMIEELLQILRQDSEPISAWAEVITFCKRHAPDYPWGKLARPPLTRDIDEANKWLSRELNRLPEGGGLYLGLDTLNMRNGSGKNLEIGVSEQACPKDDTVEFCGGVRMGSEFLIRGLVKMEKTYSEWAGASMFASYVLFLSYSGIVLSGALRRVFVADPMCVAWGFHDGDMYVLGRLELSGFTPRFS